MIEKLIAEMIAYYAGDAPRIQHFIKVHSFSRAIAVLEAALQKIFKTETGIRFCREMFGV
ncbi:MAG: hypothetical protein LUE92_12010 [Clostridiales bacterium]|nr:hypothetical protein [Clostridiales bacterium]